jgi:ketosteroid isomerase-like protein
MRLILFAGLTAFASTAVAESGSLSGPAVDAANVVDAFHAALHRGDAAAAASLLAEHALIFESGGAEHDKAEYVAHHLPADAEFSKATSFKVTRRSGNSDGGVAWIASEGKTTGTFKGKAINTATTETMVLRMTRAGWRIVHIHWSSAR